MALVLKKDCVLRLAGKMVAVAFGGLALLAGLLVFLYSHRYDSDDGLIARVNLVAIEKEACDLLTAGRVDQCGVRAGESLPVSLWPRSVRALKPRFVDVEEHSLWIWWGDHIGCRGFRIFDHDVSEDEARQASTLDLVMAPRKLSPRVWFYKGL